MDYNNRKALVDVMIEKENKMAGICAEHINPLLIAARQILQTACQIDAVIGKPTLEGITGKTDTFAISINLIGDIKGQALLAFDCSVACDIASRMCMMPITEMDALSKSAICELGNMIMGNAATVFSTHGISVDITPPLLIQGDVLFSKTYGSYICIPIIYDGDKVVELHFAARGND